MNIKHTPGPWDAASSGQGLPLTRIGATKPNVVGGGYDSHCVALLAGTRSLDETNANARLIAAAPELLSALQMAVRQNGCDMLMTGEELRACEAAIAKATEVPMMSADGGKDIPL